MELKKHPETEMEYWQAIEALGGHMFSTSRWIKKGTVEDPDGEIQKGLEEMRATQLQLAEELSQKFGVILPSITEQHPNGAPEGKIFYRVWYEKMKTAHYEEEYETIICSACPYSEGANVLSRRIPCSLFFGSIYQLMRPHQCGLVDTDSMTRGELLAKIHAEHGNDARKAFLKKEEELLLANAKK